MMATRSTAQQLGRVLERVTRQSGRLPETPAYGSWLLGRVSESQARRRVRIQLILTVFIVGANVIGISVATLLLTVAFPKPSIFSAALLWITFGVTPAYCAIALGLGTYLITRRTTGVLRWSIEEQEPTPADEHATFTAPFWLAFGVLLLWVLGTALLTTLYGLADSTFIPIVGFCVSVCGILVSTACYLFTEFALRPVAAQALEAGGAPRRLAPGIMGRTLTVWLLGSGVPMLGIFVTALLGGVLIDNLSKTQLAIAILVISAAALVFGFVLMWILAWLTATPLRVVRAALKRVEDGDLRGDLVVFDGTELGELQRGFNSMVDGLRERERVRDLFGRHVGREVAAAAERDMPQLGGEERHVAVVFIDVIGSTQLVTSRPAAEVVSLLNRFFAVIVEEVDRHHGLVNKFEGDAVLAVFGAPNHLDRPEAQALGAARAIARRLESEVPECKAGIGVTAGNAVAVNVGAKERFEYTVIGEPVNEAARLCELAKKDPHRLLASSGTVDAAGDDEQARWSLGESVTLRGHDQPTQLASLA
jgi:adenylate cyclase